MNCVGTKKAIARTSSQRQNEEAYTNYFETTYHGTHESIKGGCLSEIKQTVGQVSWQKDFM